MQFSGFAFRAHITPTPGEVESLLHKGAHIAFQATGPSPEAETTTAVGALPDGLGLRV